MSFSTEGSTAPPAEGPCSLKEEARPLVYPVAFRPGYCLSDLGHILGSEPVQGLVEWRRLLRPDSCRLGCGDRGDPRQVARREEAEEGSMRLARTAFVTVAVATSSVAAEDVSQTDWSGGFGVAGPATEWTDAFSSTEGVSWLSVPGQLALSSSPLEDAVEHELDNNFERAIHITAADIDSDGDNDLLGAAYALNAVAVWWNDGGSPAEWTKQTVDGSFAGPCEVFSADVDGDGRMDVLGSAYTGGEIAWWRNDGGVPIGWTKHAIDDEFAGAHDVWAGDLDGDGDTDVLGAAAEDDEVAWWSNEGGDPITWTEQVIDGDFDYACRLDVADFDGDGVLDVLSTAWNDGEIAWWRSDGATPPGWTKQVIRSGFTGTHGVCACDVDLDGNVDVLGAAMTLGDVAWWRNSGGYPITWNEQPVDGSFPGAGYVDAVDADGDGDVDVLASAWSNSGIAWYESVFGAGRSWIKHSIVSGVGQASSVEAADVDGDGDLDALGTLFDAGDIGWWEVTEFTATGELTSSILDTGTDPHLPSISWTSVEPQGTSLSFQLRSSDDHPGDIGQWSDDVTVPGNLAFGLNRYVQYKVMLGSTDPAYSAILKEVTVSWSLLDAHEQGAWPNHCMLRPCVPNPARSETTVEFATGACSHGTLRVLDLSGHVVKSVISGAVPAGHYEVRIRVTDLPAGLYLCRLNAGDATATSRFVVAR
jgi:hypothetical protein